MGDVATVVMIPNKDGIAENIVIKFKDHAYSFYSLGNLGISVEPALSFNWTKTEIATGETKESGSSSNSAAVETKIKGLISDNTISYIRIDRATDAALDSTAEECKVFFNAFTRHDVWKVAAPQSAPEIAQPVTEILKEFNAQIDAGNPGRALSKFIEKGGTTEELKDFLAKVPDPQGNVDADKATQEFFDNMPNAADGTLRFPTDADMAKSLGSSVTSAKKELRARFGIVFENDKELYKFLAVVEEMRKDELTLGEAHVLNAVLAVYRNSPVPADKSR